MLELGMLQSGSEMLGITELTDDCLHFPGVRFTMFITYMQVSDLVYCYQCSSSINHTSTRQNCDLFCIQTARKECGKVLTAQSQRSSHLIYILAPHFLNICSILGSVVHYTCCSLYVSLISCRELKIFLGQE